MPELTATDALAQLPGPLAGRCTVRHPGAQRAASRFRRRHPAQRDQDRVPGRPPVRPRAAAAVRPYGPALLDLRPGQQAPRRPRGLTTQRSPR